MNYKISKILKIAAIGEKWLINFGFDEIEAKKICNYLNDNTLFNESVSRAIAKKIIELKANGNDITLEKVIEFSKNYIKQEDPLLGKKKRIEKITGFPFTPNNETQEWVMKLGLKKQRTNKT